jgi:spermidine synthase
MTVSFLLLLSYQTREGSLYGALGGLTAAFMLGLAAGAAGAHVAGRRRGGSSGSRTALLAALLAAGGVFGTIAVMLPALAVLSGGPPHAALVGHALLLLLAGSATGALFPVATGVLLAGGDDAGTSAARFESADHLGAALAALLAGVTLVPALGMSATGLLACAVVLLAAVDAARAG